MRSSLYSEKGRLQFCYVKSLSSSHIKADSSELEAIPRGLPYTDVQVIEGEKKSQNKNLLD